MYEKVTRCQDKVLFHSSFNVLYIRHAKMLWIAKKIQEKYKITLYVQRTLIFFHACSHQFEFFFSLNECTHHLETKFLVYIKFYIEFNLKHFDVMNWKRSINTWQREENVFVLRLYLFKHLDQSPLFFSFWSVYFIPLQIHSLITN